LEKEKLCVCSFYFSPYPVEILSEITLLLTFYLAGLIQPSHGCWETMAWACPVLSQCLSTLPGFFLLVLKSFAQEISFLLTFIW